MRVTTYLPRGIKDEKYPDPVVQMLVQGQQDVDALYTILHRALNCWAEAPKEWHELHSQLANAPMPPKLLPFNPPLTPPQRVE